MFTVRYELDHYTKFRLEISSLKGKMYSQVTFTDDVIQHITHM